MGGDEQIDLGIPGVSGAQEIGRGGFGIVYRARQDAFDRTVAVKVLNVPHVDDDVIRRFERELRAVGALSGHPSIVSVHAHGATVDGHPYLLMEYCAGGSFGDALAARGAFGWDEATSTAVSIAGAVETAHRAGILHRDIKPDNLLTDAYGTPKLTDFGIARISSQASTTRTGSLTGSPAHISPEVVAGQTPTPSSDVYSLASTVHTLVAGKAPFQNDDDTSILPLLNRILTEDPPDLGHLGVPDPVREVLGRGMAKDPGERFGTAKDFGEALQRARAQVGLDPASMRVMGDSRQPARSAPDAGATVMGADTPRPVLSPRAPTPASVGAVGAGGTDDPPGKRSRGPVLAISAVVLVLVLAGIGFALSGGDDGGPEPDPDETTTTTTEDGTSTSASETTTTTAAAGPEPVDAAAFLFPLSELPGYIEADPSLAESDPAEAFCGNLVDVGGLETYETVAYQASDVGPFVVSTVAVFSTPDAAAAYAEAIVSSLTCDSWVDDDGFTNSAVYVPIETAAEQSDGYTQFVDTPNGTLDGDLSLVREGRVLAVIANVAFSPNDKDFSDFLAVRQAELIVFGA